MHANLRPPLKLHLRFPAQKRLYNTFPAPDLNGFPPVSPYAGVFSIPGGDPGLPPADQVLFATGDTGLNVPPPFVGPDTRITNVKGLQPDPFQLTRRCRLTPSPAIRAGEAIDRAPTLIGVRNAEHHCRNHQPRPNRT